MTIKHVKINNHKKCLTIETAKGSLTLPFSKLPLTPTSEDPIAEIAIDPELAKKAVTYKLQSGREDSVHLDAFLDYNKDPEYMKNLALYNLTVKAINLLERSNIPKREIARRLTTSPPQVYRLLDTTNYAKSIDQMVKLISILGCDIDFVVQRPPAGEIHHPSEKFRYLEPEELRKIPSASKFRPMLSDEHRPAA